jgi:UDP-glucose 4-epimerase
MPELGQEIRRVLVTGGAGFIGSAVVSALQQMGVEVTVVDDLSFGNRAFLELPDQQFHEFDIRDQGRLEELLHQVKPDWILHLAAVHFIPWCNAHPYESADINIRGTLSVLNAAKKFGRLKGLFFASTAAVYPICDVAVSEDFSPAPLDIYGLTKLTGEHLCHEYHLQSQVPTVVCRFFNAFGPNETNPHLIPEIQQQVLAGSRVLRLGNLTPKRDFIHTHDMARAVCALLKCFKGGFDVFNLGRGIEYSVTEIVDAFSTALGESVTIETDPAKVRKSDRLHLLADISKIKSFTGWEPQIGIEEGIATLVANR